MISLKKVSLFVFTTSIAAFYVSAEDKATVPSKTVEVASVEFSQLLAKFDKDNNGLLSKAEVAVSKDELLIKRFDSIDTNADAGLNEEELKTFTNSLKAQ